MSQNEHAKIIYDHVFHSFPYNQFIPNFRGEHAEDCEGCIIEAEVDKLVAKLESLSHVEDVIAELERERDLRKLLSDERHQAFVKAGVDDEGQSIANVVETIVNQRNDYRGLLASVRESIKFLLHQIGSSNE